MVIVGEADPGEQLGNAQIRDGAAVMAQFSGRLLKGTVEIVDLGENGGFIVTPPIGMDGRPLRDPDVVEWPDMVGDHPEVRIFAQ